MWKPSVRRLRMERKRVTRVDSCASAARHSGLFDALVGFGGGEFDVLMLNVQAEPAERAHIRIRDPYQAEPPDQIAAPSRHKQFEIGQRNENCRNVMAEVIFAGEKIKGLSLIEFGACLLR